MLDATPAAEAPTRAPAVPPTVPSAPVRPRSKPTSLLAAAAALAPHLEAGRRLDANVLREAMTGAFGESDAVGAWSWRDAYDAAEAALVLFLQRWGRPMRREAGSHQRMLAMLEMVAALEPSQTRRSEEQLRFQQFSTPLPLAYAALQAAAVRPGDVVLEPSAGTGMLAVMAECALGAKVACALHLNELAATRAEILQGLFPDASVTRHNAESIADYLPGIRPSVVLMNPPFSVSPDVKRIRHDADLRHVRSAFLTLPPGGRLVAITSRNCLPGDADWRRAFARLDACIVFSLAIDGRVYARRGTTFDTRLTVLDRANEPDGHIAIDPDACVADAAALLDTVTARVPPRLPITLPEPAVRPTGDLFAGTSAQPIPRPPASPRRAARAAVEPGLQPTRTKGWGPVAELAYETGPGGAVSGASEETTATAGPYEPWRPHTVRIAGAHEHPTPLVQSAAMGAVPHPAPNYRPILPERVVAEGLLSDAQLESIVLAGQAHSRRLATEYRVEHDWENIQPVAESIDPDNNKTAEDETPLSPPVRFRRGWMLGDGTGTGKGRQVAAVILDRWLRGKRRALWLSASDKLLEDARRDWSALGGDENDVFYLGKFRQGADIPHDTGILFATYATLRSPARSGSRSRLDQIVTWLAGGLDHEHRHAYDGVVVFDESHAMANAGGGTGSRGRIAPSQQGRAGLRLQHALPDARILYVSATGASTLSGLAYAQRLGLWGSGETPFERRQEFVSAMEAGGVAAMEMVARDLKSLGLYQARALSYDGVEVEILEHALSPEQRRIYDAYAEAFKIIHAHIEQALKATGVTQSTEDSTRTLNRAAKSAAISAFESAKQRFFGHLLTSMKCPTLVRAIEADLAAGHASVVQLVSTGEALMERRIAQIPASEWHDLSIDLTPREYVLDYLAHAFPIQLQESFTNESGDLMSRPVFDADGNPMLCQEAVAARDALIEKLAALPPVQAALDQLLHHFGDDAVAEVTGRSRRVLRITDASGSRLALRSRAASANLAETAAFMSRDKRILVFSMAGGTGRSYHADLGCTNTARRHHYLLEPGWRADQAIQGLGRTHRTHQASAPLFRPIATDVKGERRFISTIARRLDSLGAITRGQRDSQSAMGEDGAMFRPEDNLESTYAKAALRRFYTALYRGDIEGWGIETFEEATGLSLTYEGTLKEVLPPMSRFLNRLLALPIDEQNQLFEALEVRIAALITEAMESGTFDRGVETIHADSLALTSREPVFFHKTTEAVTELCEIARRDKLDPLTVEAALALRNQVREPSLMVNERSHRAALVLPHASRMLEDGGVESRVRLVRPATRETMARMELDASNWHIADEAQWRTLWETEIAGLPSHTESRMWLVSGLLLPIWDRLPDRNMRVWTLTTDTGERLIGRVLDAAEVHDFRAALGLAGGPGLSPAQLHQEVITHGTAFPLANGWRIARRRLAGADRIEIEGPADGHIDALKRLGCVTEIVSYRTRVFVPAEIVLTRIIEHWPLAA